MTQKNDILTVNGAKISLRNLDGFFIIHQKYSLRYKKDNQKDTNHYKIIIVFNSMCEPMYITSYDIQNIISEMDKKKQFYKSEYILKHSYYSDSQYITVEMLAGYVKSKKLLIDTSDDIEFLSKDNKISFIKNLIYVSK